MTARRLAAAIAILILVLLAIVFLRLTNTTITPTLVRSTLAELGMWGPLALMAALATVLVLPIVPASAFQIAAGLAFGPFGGLVCVVVADVAGASIGFWLARYWGQALSNRYLSAATQARVTELARQLSWQRVFLLRFIPGPVYPVVSFAAGYSSLNYLRFILASLAGVLPGLIVLVLAGDLAEQATLVSIALIILLVAGVVIAKRCRGV